jgi:RNA polymerase sigma factor (sigma-70 family)
MPAAGRPDAEQQTITAHALSPLAPVNASDDILMARFCRGDEAAFETLYDRYAGVVFGFLNRMLHDQATAEDTLQSTFLSFVRARGRYEAGTSVRGWLFAIAANAGRDALRRRKARREEPADPAFEGVSGDASAAPDPALARDIEVAFAALPAAEREAIILHKICGFSFEEIAASLGITATAAKVRAHRGYQRLRVLLAETPEVEDRAKEGVT